MVSDILRLPLRAVVASSSATRSSRSAQQSPPRSAALADGIATPPTNRPAAAASAVRLADFHSPPIIRTSLSVSLEIGAGSSYGVHGLHRRLHASWRPHSQGAS